MPIRSYISDPNHKKIVEVDDAQDERRALVVATRPLKSFIDTTKFYMNVDQGSNLNIDASSGGTPDLVYNENIEWTMTDIVGGTWVFDDTDNVFSGSVAIKGKDTQDNHVAQADKGSNIDLSGFVSLTGHIYITKWQGVSNVQVYGWDTSTGLQVGIKVNIGDYVNTATFNMWQKFTIPLSDMVLSFSTIDALRFQTIRGTTNPDFWLDLINFEQTGTPIEYSVEADQGTWLHIDEINHTFISALNTTLLSSSMPNLSYNQLLSVSALSGGIIYRQIIDGKIEESFVVRQLSDFLQIADTKIGDVIGDGTNTLLTIKFRFQEPIILKSNSNDKLTATISDDLSGFILYRINVSGKIEQKR